MSSSLAARSPLLEIAAAAIERLDPERLVREWVRDDGRPTTVVSIGKAAEAMARGARKSLGDSIVGTVCAGPASGSHPLPDERSLASGRAVLSAVTNADAGQRVLALISGGGSSLAVLPPDEISLDDIRETGRVLISSGVPIEKTNIVRKHVSQIKGGRLALAAMPASLETLILSDVACGDSSAVASGPTMADPSSYLDALAVVRGLAIPSAVVAFLEAGARGDRRETPSAVTGRVHVLADNRALVAEAARAAGDLGLMVVVAAHPLVGEPRGIASALSVRLDTLGSEQLIVAGGEPTPRVPDGAPDGGRAHHLALLIAMVIAGRPGARALILGSDGVDGASGGAGALVSSQTAVEMRRHGTDPERAIATFDSARALAALGCQIPARATGTNLADLVLVWTGGGNMG